MDHYQRPGNSAIFKRLFLNLLIISVTYIGLVRPVQEEIITKLIVPYFENKLSTNNQVSISGVWVDQFNLVGPFKPVKIELPFNGWFWLTLGLFIPADSKRMIKILTLYHLALFFILLISIQIIAEGTFAWSVVLNIHDHVYRVLFLIIALLDFVRVLSRNPRKGS